MLGIIIQARTGSTRLPSKMILNFYKDTSLIEVILERVKSFGIEAKIILATSTNTKDDILEKIAQKQGIFCFRGDENNVLNRFINAATHHGCDKIIRVCADNPLLDQYLFKEVLKQAGDADYCSYFMDNEKPVIKTHYGFFIEFVTLNALRKIEQLTNDTLYKEHVTNYLYAHPELFNIKKIHVPQYILDNPKIRLTIDTETDFAIGKAIYAYFCDNRKEITAVNIIEYLKTIKEYSQLMQKEIEKNEK